MWIPFEAKQYWERQVFIYLFTLSLLGIRELTLAATITGARRNIISIKEIPDGPSFLRYLYTDCGNAQQE